ncbi:MAG: hypothetical protein SFY69_05245, partial [Planctomycetota bacterium]|nr:hypothetical protein [Planctomycetota bacterium]
MKTFVRMSAALALAVCAGQALAQVQHGYLNVVENDAGNTEASVTTTRVGGHGPWAPIAGDPANANSRGDYFVNFFTGADDTSGVLMLGVNESYRVEPSVTEAYIGTAMAAPSATTDKYFVAIFRPPLAGTEVNINTSLAYFPVADGWLTAALYNAANNAGLQTFVGTPGLQIRQEANYTGTGIEVLDFTLGGLANGHYMLSAEGVDLRRDGLVLVCGAKNEDNRGDVFANYDGTAVLHCMNISSESGGENDPVAFVFIPEGTAGVTMASFSGAGKPLFRQGDFTIELVDPLTTNGTYRITIPGESPSTGTMIACPHSELSGTTIDNPVTVRPDGDSWILETYDTEPLPAGMQLQDLSASDVVFHFAFFKNGVNIQPGTPSRWYEARENDIVSARFVTTEITAANGLGDMDTVRSAGSDALECYGPNRGDYGIGWLQARLAARNLGPNSGGPTLDTREGVMMPVSSEFFRDNSVTGGLSGWATIGFDAGEVRGHVAGLGTNPEINSNFNVAFFPASRGLNQDAGVVTDAGTGVVTVGGNAATDGVLIACNWQNNNRFVTATTSGGDWNLQLTYADDQGGTVVAGGPVTTSGEYGYVYLPYNAFPNFVAGQVSNAATVLSGTNNFTVATGTDTNGFPVTTVTIPGVDARTDGVLLVTSMDAGRPIAVEAGPNGEFEVAGLDFTTATIGQIAFCFAYIPYEGLGGTVTPPCDPDFNQDGNVDQDDIACISQVVAGDPSCSPVDPDFNRDGNVDQDDIASL